MEMAPIHDKAVPPMIAVNYVVQDLTQYNGAMRIITWTQMSDSCLRKAPDLESSGGHSSWWVMPNNTSRALACWRLCAVWER